MKLHVKFSTNFEALTRVNLNESLIGGEGRNEFVQFEQI